MFSIIAIALAIGAALLIWTSGSRKKLSYKILVSLVIPILALIFGLAFATLDRSAVGDMAQKIVFVLIMGSFIVKYVIIDMLVHGIKQIMDAYKSQPKWSRMKQIDQELTLELEDGTVVNGYFDAMLKDNRLAVSLSGADQADWKLVKGTCSSDDIDKVIEDLTTRASKDMRDEAGNTVPLTV